MRIVIDVETERLINPQKIWVIVCYDIDTKKYHIFREQDLDTFKEWSKEVTLWIAHNGWGFDFLVLNDLLGTMIGAEQTIDTLIISKMVDYPRQGHSVEDYGVEFGMEKIKFSDYSRWSQELEDYCVRDVDITYRIYKKYLRYISDVGRQQSILLEHRFQNIVNILTTNGFSFNTTKATKYLDKVTKELDTLDKEITLVFKPKSKLIRLIEPRLTKFNTIAKSSIPKVLREYLGNDLSCFSADAPFSFISFQEFNPSSHKQIIDVLHNAGWRPIDKTKTHLDTERELNRLKRQKNRSDEVDLKIKSLYTDLHKLEKYGYKINENNLNTLPPDAPAPARYLAKRILLEARRRTLTEWLSLVQDDGRIHGRFYSIGAWTHRMAHQQPNTANIPNEFDTAGKVKLLGKEMRSLWQVPRNRLLVGVDAEGIQLRIFAHYIDDPEFTKALVEGKKDDKSDPHSLNQRIIGEVCKSRAAAKRFIYALLLGAGLGKLREVLECSEQEVRMALDNIMSRYQGFEYLKQSVIPNDAKRGWFEGLDGRAVKIPGDTVGGREHLCMSGYLQNGEAVVMKKATLLWHDQLTQEKVDFKLVNFVHDEWQTECPNDMSIALHIAKTQADALRTVGEELKLKCPLAGSYWNDDHNDYTIATNWAYTH